MSAVQGPSKPGANSRDPAIEAGARALDPQAWQDNLWTPFVVRQMQERARQKAASVIDAAAPHLTPEPIGYAVATPLGRAAFLCATLDGAQHLRELLPEDAEGGLRVVALIPMDEP